jgi:hypothetical protein
MTSDALITICLGCRMIGSDFVGSIFDILSAKMVMVLLLYLGNLDTAQTPVYVDVTAEPLSVSVEYTQWVQANLVNKAVAHPLTAGTRRVTPQRKQNNRRAQQRYREKRKAQTAHLEQQVISLANEIEALQVRFTTACPCTFVYCGAVN